MTATAQSDDPADTSAADEVRAALQSLYHDLDKDVSQLGPVCELSGRCCRFKEYGHTLFLSAPEVALLLADAPAPSRPLDDGESCPWQDHRGRCTAREARPLGCRIYFCDPAFESHAPELSETYLGRLKNLVDQNQWSWNYAPLHHHLHWAQSEGRLAISLAPSSSDPFSKRRQIGWRSVVSTRGFR